jgi:hypothetical protein
MVPVSCRGVVPWDASAILVNAAQLGFCWGVALRGRFAVPVYGFDIALRNNKGAMGVKGSHSELRDGIAVVCPLPESLQLRPGTTSHGNFKVFDRRNEYDEG